MPSGSCLCGAITYEYTGTPALTALCHCTDCQKWSGGAGTSNVVVSSDAFKITKGEPKVYTKIGGSGSPQGRYFCGDCGSSLYAQPESMPDTVLIKGGTLDGGAADVKPTVELYTKDRRGFAKAVEGAGQMTTMT